MNHGAPVPEESARRPRACPVCRIAMITERSAPEPEDMFRCLSCGSVIVGKPADTSLNESEAGLHLGANRVPKGQRAMSAVDQFVMRRNIAIYERRLAREFDAQRRALLLSLLARERAKQVPLDDQGRN